MFNYGLMLSFVTSALIGFADDAQAFANRTKLKETIFAEKLDADGGGSFTLEEFLALDPPRGNPTEEQRRERFKKMDANKDGSVSKEEFMAE